MRLSKISNNQKVTQFRMQYRDRTSSAWLVKVKLNLLVIVSRLSYYWSIEEAGKEATRLRSYIPSTSTSGWTCCLKWYLQPSQSHKLANADIKSCMVQLSAARKQLQSKFRLFNWVRFIMVLGWPVSQWRFVNSRRVPQSKRTASCFTVVNFNN